MSQNVLLAVLCKSFFIALKAVFSVNIENGITSFEESL